ncbi:hypothetical protein [uncultured Oscillibacter sp.]|uniref:hypothetical protein n=1 Tax=uncultured Oscillibacter sp. TaxID=876091 RepID=UPI0025D4A604|nr:hypothetical protein [uncultured Oscillibacter sp.]
MTMSEAEICQSYMEAKDKVKQRGVLAELNLCAKKDIDGILIRRGILEPAPVKASNSKINNEAAQEMHRAGKTDREIAAAFDCSVATVQGWRLRNELRPNPGPRQKRAPVLREKDVQKRCGAAPSAALKAGPGGVGIMDPAARKESKGITVEIYFPDGVAPCQIRILEGNHGKS